MTNELTIRSYKREDFRQLIEVQRECFPPPYPEEQLWNHEQLECHITLFPEGALCAEISGVIVGSATSLIVQFDPRHPEHTWARVSDNGYIRTHNPRGNVLYGIDMAVRPAYRRQGIARALYEARYDLVRRLRLDAFVAGGRMPGYHLYRRTLTPEDYANKVIEGLITDPVLTPQLRSGLKPIVLLRDYLPDDESGNCALLLCWKDPECEVN